MRVAHASKILKSYPPICATKLSTKRDSIFRQAFAPNSIVCDCMYCAIGKEVVLSIMLSMVRRLAPGYESHFKY